MNDAAFWIEHLALRPHPEGGYFRETYRAPESIPAAALPARFSGSRAFSTAIYFLLTRESFSAFHRIRSDEMWHFYDGNAVTLWVLDEDGGGLASVRLGSDPTRGEAPQAVVPAGAWFAAEIAAGGTFALVGCTVAPGFDFVDFELAERATLVARHPEHRDVVERLSRVG